MSEAPFATLLTPLSTVPVVAAMAIAGYGCLNIIVARYGLDLAVTIPNFTIHNNNVEAPILLAGAALFGAIQGWKMRQGDEAGNEADKPFGPIGWLEKLSIAAALVAFVTIPYWLSLPIPEAWVVAISAVSSAAYRKVFNMRNN